MIGGVFISHLGEDTFSAALLANVSEPADITLFAFLLVTILAVGLALLGVDAVVRRIRVRRAPSRAGPVLERVGEDPTGDSGDDPPAATMMAVRKRLWFSVCRRDIRPAPDMLKCCVERAVAV